VGTTFLFGTFGLAGRGYMATAFALGAAFLALAFRGITAGATFKANRWAKHVFVFSILYLTLLLIALLLDRS
jgi:protoheme IX farnesyltransferase